MEKIRPLISYYGGKQRIASRIITLLPKHVCYAEPFFGGGAVLFAKPYPKQAKQSEYIEVVNDLDESLINLYRVFQDPKGGAELKRIIGLTLYSEAEHKKAIGILTGKIQADPLWKAWAYYVSINCSFSHKLNGTWGRGATGDQAALFANKVASIEATHRRFRGVNVACSDALKFIKNWDSPSTLFYCDPPYIDTNCGHYDSYTRQNFVDLISKLDKIQGSFLLSCYEPKNIEIPSDWEKFEIDTFCSASPKGKKKLNKGQRSTMKEMLDRGRKEIVYRKINRNVSPEIQKIYNTQKCFV